MTRPIHVGNVKIGGGAPVAVQSMTKTDTRDVDATVAQIRDLGRAGCEIVRLAVPDSKAAAALKEIKAQSPVPLIADIHFNHVFALRAVEAGIDGLRLNPGNIGSSERVEAVVRAASERRIPIRIGVNSGSLEKDLLPPDGRATAEAMVESALRHVAILERLGFEDIKISLKATHVATTVAAYRLMSRRVDYPLHLGITEAGTPWAGTVKSAAGLGALLCDGIGDTLRVSLAGDPVEEVRVGYEVLKALGIRERGPVLIVCPTCGRDELDLMRLAEELERHLVHVEKPIKIALMGCVVNGPGEATVADLGIAGGGRGVALLYRNGEVIKKVSRDQIVSDLMEEITKLTGASPTGSARNQGRS